MVKSTLAMIQGRLGKIGQVVLNFLHDFVRQ
jgi:hypothetical protein